MKRSGWVGCEGFALSGRKDIYGGFDPGVAATATPG